MAQRSRMPIGPIASRCFHRKIRIVRANALVFLTREGAVTHRSHGSKPSRIKQMLIAVFEEFHRCQEVVAVAAGGAAAATRGSRRSRWCGVLTGPRLNRLHIDDRRRQSTLANNVIFHRLGDILTLIGTPSWTTAQHVQYGGLSRLEHKAQHDEEP